MDEWNVFDGFADSDLSTAYGDTGNDQFGLAASDAITFGDTQAGDSTGDSSWGGFLSNVKVSDFAGVAGLLKTGLAGGNAAVQNASGAAEGTRSAAAVAAAKGANAGMFGGINPLYLAAAAVVLFLVLRK
jgi:hypothetical protein